MSFYQYLITILLLYLIIYSKSIYSGNKAFFYFVLTVGLFELVINKAAKYFWHNTILTTNIYCTLTTSFYIFFLLTNNLGNEKKKLIYYLTGSWFIVSILVLFLFVDYMNRVSPMYNIGMILSIFLILRYAYRIIRVEEYKPIAQRPLLFTYLGILLFFTAAFPIITFVNHLIISNQFSGVYSQMLRIGNIFLALGYLTTVISLKRAKKQQQYV